ncbi:MAG: hypothetical protein ACKO3F_04540 [Cyanobium sp.]
MAIPESLSAGSSSPGADPRRQTLVNSLRSRYRSAEASENVHAKQALFKEAVYLGIHPEEIAVQN